MKHRKNKNNQSKMITETTESKILCFLYTFSSAAAQVDLLDFMRSFPHPMGKAQLENFLKEYNHHFDNLLFEGFFKQMLENDLIECSVQKLGTESSKLYSITEHGKQWLEEFEVSEVSDINMKEELDFNLVQDIGDGILYTLRNSTRPLTAREVYLMVNDDFNTTILNITDILHFYVKEGLVYYITEQGFKLTSKGLNRINAKVGNLKQGCSGCKLGSKKQK